ncbi:hypothetical protein LY90DRAFT_393245 [Neocallimastix californiae]|jgi:hypothetical protein|uniref:Non-structural maintenance of chromosomes element 4 n=1 Tax=Neocallimastix californiae TaxID=1754190 RepID=A0A1Y1YWK4_9FUNG|nr:hypothetical protein LY90DRAFT_393245 [Neocallimastix californiae]|eukprot:ORY02077.1 hypothetical protein LY90DRAFT_393245 [Neocallimastix californiae]
MDDDNGNDKLNKFYSLSENENRKIRMKYRNHIEGLPDVNSPDKLIEIIESVDELYQKVNRTQEATLDSQFLLESAEIGAKQAESMKLAGENFDTEDWINKLLTIMGGRHDIKQEDEDNEENVNLRSLKWENIGIRAEPFFDRVPKIDNMIGPLSTEQKEKRSIVRHTRENKNSVNLKKPQEIRKEDIKEQENETTKNVFQIGEILEQKGQVNLFEFIVNPDSFSQTVENIFYLSFLIRDGKALLDEKDGELIIERTDPPDEEDYLHGIKKKQFVLEIDENTWKEIIEVYDIKEPMIPTRPKVQMNNSKWYGLQ